MDTREAWCLTAAYLLMSTVSIAAEAIQPANQPPIQPATNASNQLVHCPDARRLANGRVSQQTTTDEGNVDGVQLAYTCDEGYVMKGPNRRMCGADGQWEGAAPICEARTCGPPDEVEHAVLVDDVKTVYQDKEKIEYRCQTGYYSIGKSSERRCRRGVWSRSIIFCRLHRCRYIEPPENGERMDSNNFPGERTEFRCNTGHNMVGTRSLLCLINGQWSPSRPPVCEIVHCPDARRLANGRVSQQTTTGERNVYGVQLIYTCDEGYVRKGPNRRMCGADGQWEGAAPICEEPTCRDLGDLWNGELLYTDENRGVYSAAYFLCNDDSDLEPADREELSCKPKGDEAEWDYEPPKCQRKSKITPKQNTIMYQYKHRRWTRFTVKTEFTHGEHIQIQCVDRYELKSRDGYLNRPHNRPQVLSRNDNGTWVPNVPECVKIRCDLSVHQHMVFTSGGVSVTGKVDHRSNVVGACAEKHEYKFPRDEPSVSRKCDQGVLRMPHCIPRTCRLVPQQHAVYTDGLISGRMLATPDRVPSGVTVYTRCVATHELYTNSAYLRTFSSTCDHGDWSRNDFPTCREKRCDIDLLDNVIYQTTVNGRNSTIREGGKMHSRTEVYIQCDAGYDLIDGDGQQRVGASASMTCTTGRWSAEYTCLPKNCVVPAVQNADVTLVPPQPNSGQKAKHGRRALVSCRDKHSLRRNGNKIKTFQAQCQFGEWNPPNFPICEPARCELLMMEGAKYWTKPVEDEYHFFSERTMVTSGTFVFTNCTKGFDLIGKNELNFKNAEKLTRCSLGTWTKTYRCFRKSCPGDRPESVDVFRDGTKLTGDDNVYVNEQLTVQCASGYEPRNAQEPGEYSITCNENESWSTDFPECVEKSCQTPAIENGQLWTKQSRYFTRVTSDHIAHNKDIYLNCTATHELYSTGQKYKAGNTDGKFRTRCQAGNWRSQFPECVPRRCKVPDVSAQLSLMIDTRQINNNEFARHGRVVTAQCSNGYQLTSQAGVSLDEFTASCDQGQWQDDDFPRCMPDNVAPATDSSEMAKPAQTMALRATSTSSTTSRSVASGQVTLTTTTSRSAKSTRAAMSTRTAPPAAVTEAEIATSTTTSTPTTEDMYDNIGEDDCIIEASDRYIFSDDDGNLYEAGAKVSAGADVLVACQVKAPDYNYDNTDAVVTRCDRGQLVGNYTELQCESVSAEDNCTIQHGHLIKEHFNARQYTIQCDSGFHFNYASDIKTPLYYCVQGHLESENRKRNLDPTCEPDDCVLPDPLQMPVKKNETFLNARLEIKHGAEVRIVCPEGEEPHDRKFRCSRGGWKDAETNWSWESENRTFPVCRAARCECGVCIQDGVCRCQSGTTGPRCETFVCSQECLQNGGTCTGPNTCGNCPLPLYGDNCEIAGCSPPVTNATMKVYAAYYNVGNKVLPAAVTCAEGHKLAGNHELQCVDGGVWNGRFFCLPVLRYTISVVTGDVWTDFREGTDANVYISITGTKDTIDRLSLDHGNVLKRRNLFETGETDIFVAKEFDVGKITRIRIWHDNSGSWQNWYLESVTVRINPRGENYQFYINKWLDEGNRYSATSYPHKGTVVCSQECLNNGGTCTGPNTCGNCPLPLYGDNCEIVGCMPPDTNATLLEVKAAYSVGDKVLPAVVACAEGHTLAGNHELRCVDGGVWNGRFFCLPPVLRYTISVVTGNLGDGREGTDANVYITITGTRSTIDRLALDRGNVLTQRDLFEAGKTDIFVANEFDVGKITKIQIWRDHSGSYWYLESVTVRINSRGEQYQFDIKKWLSWRNRYTTTSYPQKITVCQPFTSHLIPRRVFPPNPLWDTDNECITTTLAECLQKCNSTDNLLCKSVYYVPEHRHCCLLTVGYSTTHFGISPHNTFLYERQCI